MFVSLCLLPNNLSCVFSTVWIHKYMSFKSTILFIQVMLLIALIFYIKFNIIAFGLLAMYCNKIN